MRTFLLIAVPFALACSAPRSFPRAGLALEAAAAARATSLGVSVAGTPSGRERAPTSTAPRAPAPTASKSASTERSLWLGAEVRAYPAGVIPALYGEKPLSEHGVLTFGLGANLTDRQDFGEHEEEDGDGFGVGVGYRHYFGERLDRWFLGGRVDLWSLSIDWRDPPGASGTTDVLVLQPTVEGGYGFRLGERWRLNVFAAGGAEINVDTDGEDVGDGAIGILGVSCVFGF